MMKVLRRRPKNPINGRRISDILQNLPDQFQGETLTIADLREALHGRVYGIFLIVLALPNVVPIPAPGLSAILGFPLLLLTFQMMLGRRHPWLPRIVIHRTIRTAHLRMLCEKVVPYVRKWEKLVIPRLFILVQPPADRIIAFICVCFSVLVMLPIPFGNAMPALAICLFAIALMQRDGLFALFAGLVGTFALLLMAASIGATIIAFEKFIGII